MLLPNDAGLQHAAGGIEWVNRRIDAEFGDCTVKHRRCVKVREAGGWRRIGQVVGRHVNGLHRGDRTLIGRRNAFLQRTHVGGQGGLITHRRRNTAKKRSEEHTSELQSLMRISYAVFCLKKKKYTMIRYDHI